LKSWLNSRPELKTRKNWENVPDILKKILATKVREVAEAKARLPMAELRAHLADAPTARDFLAAIRAKHRAGKPAVIAEIKKASPSAGVFRAALDGAGATFDPARFARSYEKHGAACLSVLTDRDYFQGRVEDLVAARNACALPVLRKDFIVDEYQILDARAMGADAVLFIMGAVPIAQFQDWEAIAESLGLAVLAESHSAAELDQALMLRTPLIGINNRDLTRFVTDLGTTMTLKARVPKERIVVTESGISSRDAVQAMSNAGVNTYLIGGSLMEKSDPGAALAALFSDGLS
jgi:indole-3-glycerol phosphate synthase